MAAGEVQQPLASNIAIQQERRHKISRDFVIPNSEFEFHLSRFGFLLRNGKTRQTYTIRVELGLIQASVYPKPLSAL